MKDNFWASIIKEKVTVVSTLFSWVTHSGGSCCHVVRTPSPFGEVHVAGHRGQLPTVLWTGHLKTTLQHQSSLQILTVTTEGTLSQNHPAKLKSGSMETVRQCLPFKAANFWGEGINCYIAIDNEDGGVGMSKWNNAWEMFRTGFGTWWTLWALLSVHECMWTPRAVPGT